MDATAMRAFDAEAMADAVVLTVKAATAPLIERIAVLETRLATTVVGEKGEKGEQGPAGKDAEVDLDALALKVLALVPTPKDGVNGEKGEPGPAGKDAEVDLDALALKAAELIPVPKDGIDGKDGAAPDVEEVAKVAALLIPVPKDGAPGPTGASVDPAEVEAMVAKAVAALPAPKDGQSVTVADVAPLIAEEVEKAVKALPVPKDGVGLTGAMVGHDGRLLVTLSDGSVKDAGPVVGRDVDMAVVKTLITDEVAKFPVPTNGKDGADGIGFDDLDASFKDGVLVHRYKRGDVVLREFTWDAGTPIYMGVFREGQTYKAGQAATWGGSLWIAKSDTTAKPGENGEASRAWQLAVKRGDAGKPGPMGPQGEKGLRGEQGPMGQRGY